LILEYLQSVLTSVKNAESYDEIEEIKRELTETGYIRYRKEDKKKNKTSKPHHFVSSDGIHIYVGKNNIQNDFLTLKFADKQDIWMHTKNIPGSHVILKNNGKISDMALEEAATLAAFYSKAKESTKVPVDYTEVKNVKKPSGSKPGMVIYYTNKTIYVDPKKLELDKVE
jgi:predicted ribosome quality control (RQC) complex YloA/Tae2 family protein